MLLPRPLVALALSALALAAQRPVRRDHAIFDYYVLEHDPHSTVSIHELSAVLGLEVVEPVGELLDHWLLSLRRSEITRRDGGDPVLDTLHRLRSAARAPVLGGHHARSLHDTHHAKRLVDSVRFVERQVLRQRTKRVVPAEFEERQKENDGMPHAVTVDPLKVAAKFGIHDPLFPEQWHIVSPTYPEHMMNVTPAWEAGITGKGVIVAMVDDGIDYESDDLAPNFVRVPHLPLANLLTCVLAGFSTPRAHTTSTITLRYQNPFSQTVRLFSPCVVGSDLIRSRPRHARYSLRWRDRGSQERRVWRWTCVRSQDCRSAYSFRAGD